MAPLASRCATGAPAAPPPPPAAGRRPLASVPAPGPVGPFRPWRDHVLLAQNGPGHRHLVCAHCGVHGLRRSSLLGTPCTPGPWPVYSRRVLRSGALDEALSVAPATSRVGALAHGWRPVAGPAPAAEAAPSPRPLMRTEEVAGVNAAGPCLQVPAAKRRRSLLAPLVAPVGEASGQPSQRRTPAELSALRELRVLKAS